MELTDSSSFSTSSEDSLSNLPSCTFLDKKISSLTPTQQLIYECLYKITVDFLKNKPTDLPPGIYNWSPLTWHNVIFNLSTKVSNRIQDPELDCWFFNLSEGGKIHIQEVENRKGLNGERLYAVKGGPDHIVPLYRVVGVLAHPEQVANFQRGSTHQDHSLQMAHLCKHDSLPHRDFPPCWSPFHLAVMKDGQNKSTNKCWFGANFLCPHQPSCIWTNSRGRYLNCRNATSYRDCSCKHNCWLPSSVGYRKPQ